MVAEDQLEQIREPGDWYLFYIKREPNPLVRLLS